MKKAILFSIFILNLNNLNSRPVSYADSWTVLSHNDYYRNTFLVHYSPTSKYSIGYNVEYWKKKEYLINALNLNYLAKRINKKHSQANFYLKTGLGALRTDFEKYSNKKEFISYGTFATDWETRKLFISYSNKALKSKSIDSTFMQKARFGLAPYTAKYGALHAWLLYELKHMPEDSESLASSLLVRFFKSTNLVEIGLDQNKNTTLNFIKLF
tara:strand:+ start:58 stop:696 length:639 start_codon:yes stop_codon:yes gene_type:complete